MSTVGVGLVGAGVISEQYLRNLSGFPDVEVLFVADLDTDRAAHRAREFGVVRSGSLDDLLKRDEIEIVVNLTVPAAHVYVGTRALEAGKHVWIEKPYSPDREGARSLLARASKAGLRIAGAPDTWLGPGLQNARRLVDAGEIGEPTSATATFQNAGPEPWHPNPDFYYQPGGGPLLDMAPYYLSALVTVLGPISRVSAVSSTARPSRIIGSGPRAGEAIRVLTPTHYIAVVEFESGAVADAMFSFDGVASRRALSVTGSEGTLDLPDPNMFDGVSEVRRHGGETVSHLSETATFSRGVGVLELARAIRADVPERAGASFIGHVLDAVLSIAESAERGEAVDVDSTVDRPTPLPDGWDPFARTL